MHSPVILLFRSNNEYLFETEKFRENNHWLKHHKPLYREKQFSAMSRLGAERADCYW